MFTIAWCFVVSAIFHVMGIGLEIGALLAGISLSTSPYHYEISARIKPLRDFFLIMFFVSLGLQLSPVEVISVLPLVIALSLAVIFGKALFTYIGVLLSGYERRVAFLSALSMAQVSEFSFILIAVGISLGHLSKEFLQLTIAVGIISIAISSYLMVHGDLIYRIFFRSSSKHEEKESDGPEIILFGYNRVGYDIFRSMKSVSSKYLVVDYNPDIVSMLKKRGIHVIYGDASDIDFLSELNFSKAKMIISTIPDVQTSLFLLDFTNKSSKAPVFITTAHKIEDAICLYDAGVDYVIMPHFLGGRYASSLIEMYQTNKEHFNRERAKHKKELHERKRMGHEHPTIDFNL
jgi:voltage-gated potassium channel Kch